MNDFKKGLIVQVPSCLVDKTNLIISVAFSVLFAIVFLTLWTPFSGTSWFEIGESRRFLLTALFILVSTAFLICSRFLMSFTVRTKRHFSVAFFVVWQILEVLLIASFHAILSDRIIRLEEYSFGFLLAKSVFITFLALGFPLAMTNLIFLLYDTRKHLSITHSNYIESDGEVIPRNADIINIMDNNGNLKLSVKLDNLYYIKSEDNYINVFYTKKGVLSRYMLRCKLQNIENNFGNNGVLMRCHRSYIVNTHKIKVLRNEPEGFFMDFDCEGIDPIPVSKSYSNRIIERFSSKSS